MTNEPWKHKPVVIYQDPITRTKPEGLAYVIRTIAPPDDGLIAAEVWFVEDRAEGEGELFRRTVGVDQLAAVGIIS